MKNIAKKTALVLTALVLMVSAFSLMACNNSSKNKYTVKVLGPDGAPYTAALVQPCEVTSEGTLATCYPGVATDSNGTVTLEIGKQITNKNADLLEIHLLNLPVYLTYDPPRIHKGETATIRLREDAVPPNSGTGAGEYASPGTIELSTFDPYVVDIGAYKFKFTSADQKIYFKFVAEFEAVYKVYSVGSVDASVRKLTGTAMTGIRNGGEDKYYNDNVSDTDKNFSYEFEVEPALFVQDNGNSYFEIALENAADVNKDAVICFEYVREYEDDTVQLVPVTPSKTPAAFGECDYANYTFVDVDLYDAYTGDFTYEMGDDGFYHVGDKNGAILVASLGQDDELNDKHDGNGYAPRGYDKGFTLQHKEGGALNISGKNYFPLLEAYTKASNSEGRYGVTEELKNFLDDYINHGPGAKSWVEKALDTSLPAGKEWLWTCGYYKEAGTEDAPIAINEGPLTVKVPAGGKVYCEAFMFAGQTYTFMSDNTDIHLTYYEFMSSEITLEEESDEDGFYFELTAFGMSYYILEFSTKSGSAATLSFSVFKSEAEMPDEPDGSADNPYVIEDLETFYNYCEDPWEGIHYVYNAEDDCTLWFDWDDNTTIQVTVGSTSLSSMDESDAAKWAAGVAVSAGDRVLIDVGTVDLSEGAVSFSISDKGAFGSKENPYPVYGEDEFKVSVPAGGKVVYSFMPFDEGEYTFTVSSSDVKVVWYEKDGTEHTAQSDGDSFTLTISVTAMTIYYVEFYTVSGDAAEYTVTLEIA